MTERIAVLGLGKLGACMAACFAAKGHRVHGVDIDPAIVEAVSAGRAPFPEPGLATMIERAQGYLRASMSVEAAVRDSDLCFVVVPTPSKASGDFSLDYVLAAVSEIGRALRSKEGYYVVVITSTVLAGATAGTIVPVLEAESGRVVGRDLGVCYSPEFIALGSVVRDFMNPDFFLVGESDERAGIQLERCLKATMERPAPVVRMSIVNAEVTKLAVNTFVTAKISFANMLSSICERLPGGEVDVVTRAVGLDGRIGARYLKGGMPFGGPCFPRDNRALSFLMRELGIEPELPDAVHAFNEHYLDAICGAFSRSAGSKVAVLGLSYKPGTPVLEASPGLALASRLLREGYEVHAFDPFADQLPREMLPAGLSVTSNLGEAIQSCDSVVVSYPDEAFATPDTVRRLASAGVRLILDPWRMVDSATARSLGLDLKALGNGAVAAAEAITAAPGMGEA
jgi:UDPglucose 6-dehydrogenase